MPKQENHQPHFYNPGLTPEQLEDWLGQQRLYLARFNILGKEKAALEERLNEISAELEQMSANGFEGILSFPWDPSPHLKSPLVDKQ